MGRSAPAGQRTFPRGSDVTHCCCPHDVAQVLGQSAGRARRVLGQVEEVSKVGDQHSRDCTAKYLHHWCCRLPKTTREFCRSGREPLGPTAPTLRCRTPCDHARCATRLVREPHRLPTPEVCPMCNQAHAGECDYFGRGPFGDVAVTGATHLLPVVSIVDGQRACRPGSALLLVCTRGPIPSLAL